MYDLEVKEEADKIFRKLKKKDSKQLEIINKKVKELREDPQGYKFLKGPLHGFNRVHIDSHFVLIFTINHNMKLITLWYYDHHDNVYQWRPKEEF